MPVGRQSRLGLVGVGVDGRAEIQRRLPGIVDARAVRYPDIPEAKAGPVPATGEVEAQAVLGDEGVEVWADRVHDRAEVDGPRPVGEAGRSVVASVISSITVAVRFSGGCARRHPDVVAATARSIGREHERSTVERQTWLELGGRRVDGSPQVLGHGPGLLRASTH